MAEDDILDAELLQAGDVALAGESALVLKMDVLRTENKVKTATYRQLFAARMTLKDIDRRLVERGL